MRKIEKELTYKTSNTYSTLNKLTPKTKYIWFVCHGMGYLSRYFLKYFQGLNSEEHYIIAPQAPSKYYLGPKFKHVGASWLTRENTGADTENIIRYFDAIFETESLPSDKKLIVLGYSQGVSVAMRYMAKRKIKPEYLVIHSGGIPNELTKADFSYFEGKVTLIYGTNDEYLDDTRMQTERQKAQNLFGKRLEIVPFEGKHEVNTDLIERLIE
ncbi:esterase [Paucihalobacter ruber]|uniref:Esterase n=1 Tax=Paucihalobacter ruber TaxID=2567861 RepID=A0A506PET9_9FLAO|nr:esterase [Paucihalobacter ruber]TPV32383.1 esterase [Paucihalobacter ruber]